MHVFRGALFVTLVTAAAFAQTPSPRLEFEVASVKKSAPPAPGQVNIGVHIDGAMVNVTSFPLRAYIRMAYNVNENQIVGPDWMATENFDIVAKVPDGASRDNIRPMIQSLLADRFKLVLHRESKEFPVYALVVGKNGPKLKESPRDAETDPATARNVNVDVAAGRGGSVVSYGKDSYVSYTSNRLEAKKMTLANLIDSLARFTDRPVVDMTNLKGSYDLTLDYSLDELRNLIRSSGGDAGQIPNIPGMDPTISIFSSLEAVGLKLEPRKAPMDVLVIDHVERTPTAN